MDRETREAQEMVDLGLWSPPPHGPSPPPGNGRPLISFIASASSISVGRNSRGTTWDIKLYKESLDETDDQLIERVWQASSKLETLYGALPAE